VERVAEIVGKLAVEEGYNETELSQVGLFRASEARGREPLCYEQGIIFVVQGSKRVYLGDSVHEYNPQNFLVLSVPIPAECETFADKEEPLLAVSIDIDTVFLNQIVHMMDEYGEHATPSRGPIQGGLFLGEVTELIEDILFRLVSLLQSPLDSRILGAGTLKELLLRILQQDNSDILHALTMKNTNLSRIDKALKHIHINFTQAMNVDDLSLLVNMSPSAFHRAFNEVTASSPIQYIKKIRLDRAKELMLNNNLRVNEAATQVGYESPTQFSREFKRYYGSSPSEYLRR